MALFPLVPGFLKGVRFVVQLVGYAGGPLLPGYELSQSFSTVGSACPVHLSAGMLNSPLQYRVLPFSFQGVLLVP